MFKMKNKEKRNCITKKILYTLIWWEGWLMFLVRFLQQFKLKGVEWLFFCFELCAMQMVWRVQCSHAELVDILALELVVVIEIRINQIEREREKLSDLFICQKIKILPCARCDLFVGSHVRACLFWQLTVFPSLSFLSCQFLKISLKYWFHYFLSTRVLTKQCAPVAK